MLDTQLIKLEHFNDIFLGDPFFDTLKSDYPGFDTWFQKKRRISDSLAYTFRNPTTGNLDGFLYLKIENDAINDVNPPLPPSLRLKLGTFKVNPHGTRLGERFIKRAFDEAIAKNVAALYVTVFSKHIALVELFERYGFKYISRKTGLMGDEMVMERRLDCVNNDVVLDYPRIPVKDGRHFVLSLYPAWHSRLLPDSLLKTESSDILHDVSHTNSIHKIYLAGMNGIEQLRRGDTLLIYRTADGGSAYYTSVISSLCVVEELIHISEFRNQDEFIRFCNPYSVFSEYELRTFYQNKKYPWIIKFTYNLALTKRPNRKTLLEEADMGTVPYWGFFQIDTEKLKTILKLSGDYEKARSLVYTS